VGEGERQRERERRAGADNTPNADHATVGFDQLLDDGQAMSWLLLE
jgi:hypothetical protein